jgi:hypothetical protein
MDRTQALRLAPATQCRHCG